MTVSNRPKIFGRCKIISLPKQTFSGACSCVSLSIDIDVPHSWQRDRIRQIEKHPGKSVDVINVVWPHVAHKTNATFRQCCQLIHFTSCLCQRRTNRYFPEAFNEWRLSANINCRRFIECSTFSIIFLSLFFFFLYVMPIFWSNWLQNGTIGQWHIPASIRISVGIQQTFCIRQANVHYSCKLRVFLVCHGSGHAQSGR